MQNQHSQEKNLCQSLSSNNKETPIASNSLSSNSKIWSLTDCNWTPTHNHLVCKWTLNSPNFSSLNVKELLVRMWNRCEIWSLSNYNWTSTHNHLVRKRTLSIYIYYWVWYLIVEFLNHGSLILNSNINLQ